MKTDKTEETFLFELSMLFFSLHAVQMDLVFDFIYYLASFQLTTTRIWRLIFYYFGQSRRSQQIRLK